MINKSDFWVKDKTDNLIIHISEGTGDNLFEDDIIEGYVDYINYSIYESMEDVYKDKEFDGGMVLLKEYYIDLPLEEIIDRVVDMAEWNCSDYEIIEVEI